MESVRLIYEQIEHARVLLLSGSLLKARLALILLDNAAEVIMYRELRHVFAWDSHFKNWDPAKPPELRPKYTLEERDKATKEFDPMLRVLGHRLGRLPEDQRTVLRVCHGIRKDAFHRAEMNRNVLLPITTLLYQTVVHLSVRFRPHAFSISPQNENAEFLARFGLSFPEELGTDPGLEKIRQVLSAGIAFDSPSFAATLSDDLHERIEHIINGLAYLTELNDDREIDEKLQYQQFWRDRGAAVAAKCHARDEAWDEPLRDAYHEWKANPGPRYTFEKLRKWQRQAGLLKNAKNPARVLERYWTLQMEFVELEQDVLEAVADFDMRNG